MRTLKILGCGIVVLIAAYLAYVHWSHFHYPKPAYTLGILNSTDELLRESVLRLAPEGSFEAGSLAPGQEAFHMNPPWPVPESIDASFRDASGTRHDFTLATELTSTFKGGIVVVISKTNGTFAASIRTNAP